MCTENPVASPIKECVPTESLHDSFKDLTVSTKLWTHSLILHWQWLKVGSMSQTLIQLWAIVNVEREGEWSEVQELRSLVNVGRVY